MRFFQDIPIRRKLTMVLMLICSIGLLSEGALIVLSERSGYRQLMSEDLSTLAEIIGHQSSAALAFGDAKDAKANLANLKSKPDILAAAIYTPDGHIFARYTQEKAESTLIPDKPQENGQQIGAGQLVLFRPIEQDGEVVGTVYVCAGMERMNAHLARQVGIVVMVIIGLLLTTLLLSSAAQRTISSPILELAEVAQVVSHQKDYSVRAPLRGHDEIGELVTTFNRMLEQIQESDTALRGANSALHAEIIDRQRALEQRELAESELRESMRRYQFLADAMPQIVWTAQPDGGVNYYNQPWYDYTGMSSHPDLGREWEMVLHPEDLQPCLATWKAAYTAGKNYQDEYRFRRSDGSYRWHLIRAVPRRDEAGHILQWVGTCTDIDDYKLALDEIQLLNTDLERRVSERAKDLLDRTHELEAANSELEAFSYTVSHDLRAPVRAMLGFTRILSEEYGAELPAEAQRYLTRVSDNAEKMGALIDDLLTFSRLGRHSLQTHGVAPGKIVRQIWDDLAAEREGRDVEFQLDELPSCHADPTLLRQVLFNLISNGLKYSRGKEPAKIEVGCQEQNGEDIYFVKDNGSGFDMQYADKLFGVFQRLHRASEFEGTGVGLAIVQRIVHRHGGRVWADAAVGKGATFYFTLQKEGTATDDSSE